MASTAADTRCFNHLDGLVSPVAIEDNGRASDHPPRKDCRRLTMPVNVLDPDLCSLAADAAVELDLLINGEPTALDGVRRLGERLSQALDQPAHRLQVDTETETVLGQAFTRAGADPATILGELVQRTERIAFELSSTQSETERNALELQRAFCLALSQSAAAYRQLIFDVRPPHPYRR